MKIVGSLSKFLLDLSSLIIWPDSSFTMIVAKWGFPTSGFLLPFPVVLQHFNVSKISPYSRLCLFIISIDWGLLMFFYWFIVYYSNASFWYPHCLYLASGIPLNLVPVFLWYALIIFFSTLILSGTIRCSRLILYITWPAFGISHLY